MSMAVIADTPNEETQATEAAPPPEPTFLEIMSRQLSLRGRQLWRFIIIPIRSVFWLEEDSQRDHMIMQLQADVDYLTQNTARAMGGVNALNERLSAHEDAIPRMRVVKNQFDTMKRAEKESKDAAIKAQAQAQQDREDRLEAGVLS